MSKKTIKLNMKQTHGIKVGGSIDIENIEGVNSIAVVDSIIETYDLLLVNATAQTSEGKIGFVLSRLSARALYEIVSEALDSNLKYSMKKMRVLGDKESEIYSIYGYRGNIIRENSENEGNLFNVKIRNINKNNYSMELLIPAWKTPIFVRAITDVNIIEGIRKFLQMYKDDKNNRIYYKNTRVFWKNLQDGIVTHPGENLVSLTPQETENIVHVMFESI